jgi:hypothetical protein
VNEESRPARRLPNSFRTSHPSGSYGWRGALELLQDVLARIVWIQEECVLTVRAQSLEELEYDVAGWLTELEEPV